MRPETEKDIDKAYNETKVSATSKAWFFFNTKNTDNKNGHGCLKTELPPNISIIFL